MQLSHVQRFIFLSLFFLSLDKVSLVMLVEKKKSDRDCDKEKRLVPLVPQVSLILPDIFSPKKPRETPVRKQPLSQACDQMAS